MTRSSHHAVSSSHGTFLLRRTTNCNVQVVAQVSEDEAERRFARSCLLLLRCCCRRFFELNPKWKTLMMANHVKGAARRRRERRLRAWHRHVQTAAAAELATTLHHCAQRPRTRVVGRARAVRGEEGAGRGVGEVRVRGRACCRGRVRGPSACGRLLFNGTRLALKVPPVVVAHDEGKEKKQSGMSEGLVLTDGRPSNGRGGRVHAGTAGATRLKKWSRCPNTPGRRTAKKSRNTGPRLRLQWTRYETCPIIGCLS